MTQPASETTFVAITFDDGSVGIMQFVLREYAPDGSTRWVRTANSETVQAEIDKSVFDHAVVSWRFMDDKDEVPQDRTFRDAWKDDGETLAVDMVKARAIHRDKLRELRVPRFAALDIDYMRALESNDPVAAAVIGDAKQALRDVTIDPRIDAATTPEELKAVMPDALAG